MGQAHKGKHLFPLYPEAGVCMGEWLLLKISAPGAAYLVFSDPFLSSCASGTLFKFCS